jgi:hypothetical protein
MISTLQADFRHQRRVTLNRLETENEDWAYHFSIHTPPDAALLNHPPHKHNVNFIPRPHDSTEAADWLRNDPATAMNQWLRDLWQ